MVDWHVVYAELKLFEDRKAVVKALRVAIRKPVPQIRAAIKSAASTKLPKRGGLNRWVASTKVTASVIQKSRTVGLKLTGGRNSAGGRSDINAIDRGRVRAPAWGRKGPGQWHTQTVTAGFFTDTAADHADDVQQATTAAVDQAFDTLRR